MAKKAKARQQRSLRFSRRDRRQIFENAMTQFEEAWRDGEYAAPANALLACWRFKELLPDWVVQAVFNTFAERMTKAERRRELESLRHHKRWLMVRTLKYPVGGRGLTWEATMVAASERLKRTFAAGKPETMQASYNIVEHDYRQGRFVDRYFQLLSIPRTIGDRQGSKTRIQ